MNITDFKNQIENNEITTEAIQYKKYISIIEKKSIADKIINGCIEEDVNGLYKINYFYKYLFMNMALVTNYSDLSFSEEGYLGEFDWLSENGYLEVIIKEIPFNERNSIDDVVDEELAQIMKVNNSIESVVAQKLEKLISKIPDNKEIKKIMNDIPKMVNKIKPENLGMIKDALSNSGGLNGK